MKHLSIGLFIAYLLFISSKSFIKPASSVELGVLGCLLVLVVGEKLSKMVYKIQLKKLALNKESLDMQRPAIEDSEIASLKRENEIAQLQLRKFMTQQEYQKREIARAVEKQVGEGGLRF